ncbi:MAG TPA: Calx-beta domain-containing protein [Pyrinomonadaceae bacterium]|jgi:subtilisin family serine protease
MSKNVLLILSLVFTLFFTLSVAGGVGAAKPDSNASATVEGQTTLAQPDGEKGVRKPSRPGDLPDEAGFVGGEVLVKFKNQARADAVARGQKNSSGVLALTNERALNAIFRKHGVTEARQPFSHTKSDALRRIVKFTSKSLKHDPQGTKEMVAALRQDPEVEYAEPNYILHKLLTPNDPYFASSGAWGQGFRDLWGLEKISAEAAWDLTRGAGVVVAVIDTGVDHGHEDMAANIWLNAGESGADASGRDKRTNRIDDDGNGFIDDWRGWDFVTSDGTPTDNDPMDDEGHGTHVAGTIAAVGNNQVGIVGIAPESKVMALKGLGAGGSGTMEDLNAAIIYAADNGAKVINASWGAYSTEPVQSLIAAVAYARQKDVVFVAGAGNSAMDVGTPNSGFTPANIEDAVTVSAFNQADAPAYFTNHGPKIDVAAPGGGDSDASGAVLDPSASILSLASSQGAEFKDNSPWLVGGRYLRLHGTSMAAPHVAGVAALVRSLHPEFSAEQVRQALRAGSDDKGTAGFDKYSGYGRLNAAKALSFNSPLAVQLTAPLETLTDVQQVEVRGTVAGTGLVDWRLEYRLADSAGGWTLIHSSSTAVNNSTLAPWEVGSIGDGSFELRAIATNSAGQIFEDRVRVVINNVFITDPPSNTTMFYRNALALPIRGTVTPSNLSSYTLSVKKTGGLPLENSRITLAGGGTQTVRDGLLGTWDTTGVAAGSYDITLEVSLTNGLYTRKTVTVIIEPSIHEGSPIQLPRFNVGWATPILGDHLVAADVNGDGGHDLVVGYGDAVGIYDHAGRMLPGWPQTVDPSGVGNWEQRSPAVGDLDGDGSPEIVTRGGWELFVWRSDGTPLPGWPKQLGHYAAHAIAIADMDGDGANELVLMSPALNVVDRHGSMLPGWPVDLRDTDSPASFIDFVVCDLDADGQKEIVARTDRNGTGTDLYVFGLDGKVKAGWPQRVDNLRLSLGISAHHVAGDLDGDGDLEIVMAAADGRVHAYHHDGTIVAGWPQQTMGVEANTPAVGDIDGDGRAEVVVGIDTVRHPNNTISNYLYVWRGNGTLLPGWPVRKQGNLFGSHTFYGFGPPLLADVDGDGAIDIVASSDRMPDREVVFAFRLDGSYVAGFPKHAPTIGAAASTSPAIADLDGDGLLELAWVDFNKRLYIWDLTSKRNAPAPWPMYRHDPTLTGANYSASFKVRPSLQLSSSVYSGSEGAGAIQFTVTRTGDSSGAVSVSYATTDGTAAAGIDYTAATGTVTFAEGETTAKTVTIPIANDGLDEADEAFNLLLSAPTGGATLGPRSNATLTITDDDSTPSLAISDVSVTEGNSGTSNVAFNVTLSAQTGRTVTVNYGTIDGTAKGSLDYTVASGNLTFNPGELTKTFTVEIKGDTLDETDEAFFINLWSPTNATLGDGQASVTINDNDAAPSLSIDDQAITEAATATFTVRLSQASSQTIRVNYATANGTAISAQDYTLKSGTLTFSPGELAKTFPVTTLSDTKDEPNETFLVNLTNPVNASVADAQGTGTITDDDSPPSVSVADLTVMEGNAGTLNAIFTIKLSVASGQSLSVNYATANGTAQAGADYQSTTGTLTFDAGQTTKTVTVPIVGDTTDEPTETFLLSLSGPLNVTISDASATCTVHDNDQKLSVNSVVVAEANTGVTTTAVFTVKLSFASAKTVTVRYATANVNAIAGADYTALPLTTLTFLPGETTKTVPVRITGDALDEVNETFKLLLSSPANAAMSNGVGTATINDNDLPPTVRVSSPTVTEGNVATPVSFAVTLSAPSGQVVTVKYQTADGTATAPADYTSKPLTTLTFLPGETTKTIAVSIAGDLLDEAAESFKLMLSAPANSTIATGTGTCIITDNDLPPSITISNVTVTEPDTGAVMTTFNISFSAVSGQNVSINFATANGTSLPAIANTDYAAVPLTTLTFLPGETSKSITIQVKGDLVKEADETFFVNLSGALNATIADAQGLGTILNDD